MKYSFIVQYFRHRDNIINITDTFSHYLGSYPNHNYLSIFSSEQRLGGNGTTNIYFVPGVLEFPTKNNYTITKTPTTDYPLYTIGPNNFVIDIYDNSLWYGTTSQNPFLQDTITMLSKEQRINSITSSIVDIINGNPNNACIGNTGVKGSAHDGIKGITAKISNNNSITINSDIYGIIGNNSSSFNVTKTLVTNLNNIYINTENNYLTNGQNGSASIYDFTSGTNNDGPKIEFNIININSVTNFGVSLRIPPTSTNINYYILLI